MLFRSPDDLGRYYLHTASDAVNYYIEATVTPDPDLKDAPVFTSYILYKQDASGVFQPELTSNMTGNDVRIRRTVSPTEKGIYQLAVFEADGTVTKSNVFEVVIDKKDQSSLKNETIVVTFDPANPIDLNSKLNKAVAGTTLDVDNSVLDGVLEQDTTDPNIFHMKKSGTAILVFNAAGNDIYADKTVTYKVTVKPQASELHFVNPAPTLKYTYGDASFSAQAESTLRPSEPIIYESSDPNVLSVDSNGDVTIIGVGTAEITATLNSDDCYDSITISNTYIVEKKKITILPDNAEMVAGEALPTPVIKEAQGLLPTDNIEDFGDPVFRIVDIYNNEVTAATPEGTGKIYFDHFEDGVHTADPNVTKNYEVVLDSKVYGTLAIKKREADAAVDLTTDPVYDLTVSDWTNEIITLTPNAPYTMMQVNNSGVDVNSYAADLIGDKTYNIVLKTDAGLTAKPLAVTIKYDPTAPVIVSKAVNAGTTSTDRKIKVVADDQTDLSGVDQIRIILNKVDANNVITDHNIQMVEADVIEDPVTHEKYIEGEFTALDDARYMASISATDHAGNRSKEENLYFVVENTYDSLPLVEVSPDKPYQTGTVTITLSEDPKYPVLSGVHHFLYSTDNWATSTKISASDNKGTLDVTTSGTYEFKIVSNEEYKNSGESSAGGNAAVKTLIFDNTVPVLNITETKTIGSHTFVLSNMAANAGDVTFYMMKDNGEYVVVNDTITFTDMADNGKYKFKVTSAAGIDSDAADGFTGKEFKVSIESAVFEDITVTPKGKSWTNAIPVELTLTGGLDDMSKLQEYQYCVVDITEGLSDCTDDKWMSITPNRDDQGNFLNAKVAKASEGTFRYYFKAITVNGFEDSSKIAGPYDVLIDTTAPEGITVKPSPTPLPNGYEVEVNPLNPDINALTAEYKVLPYGVSYRDGSAAKDVPGDNIIKVTGVRGQKYQLGFLVRDEAGNETITYSSDSYTIPLSDSTAPVIELDPRPTNTAGTSYLPVHVAVTDYDDDGNLTSGVKITDEYNGIVSPITSPYVANTKGVHKITATDSEGNETTVEIEVLGIPSVNEVRPTPEFEEIINEIKKELGEASSDVQDLYKDQVQDLEDRYNALKNKKNAYTAQIVNDPLYVGGSIQMQATITNDVNFPSTLYAYELYEQKVDGTWSKIADIDGSNATIVTTPANGGEPTKTVIDYTITGNAETDGTFIYKMTFKDKDTDIVEEVEFSAVVLPKLIGHKLQAVNDMRMDVDRPMNMKITIQLDPNALADADAFKIDLYQQPEVAGGTPKLITNNFTKLGDVITDANGNSYVTYVTNPTTDFAKAEYNDKSFFISVKNTANTYKEVSPDFKIFINLMKQDTLVRGFEEIKVGDKITLDASMIQGIKGNDIEVTFTPVTGLTDAVTGETILTEDASNPGTYTAVTAGETVFEVLVHDRTVPAVYEDAKTTLTVRVVKEDDFAFAVKTLAPATYGDTGTITLELSSVLPAGAGKVEFAVTDDSRKDVVTITNDPSAPTATMTIGNAGTVHIVARHSGSDTLSDRQSEPIEFVVNPAPLKVKAKDITVANISDLNKIEIDPDNPNTVNGLKNGDRIEDLGKAVFRTDAAAHNYATGQYPIYFDHFEDRTPLADNYIVSDDDVLGVADLVGTLANANDYFTTPKEAKEGKWMNQDITVTATNGYARLSIKTPNDGQTAFGNEVPVYAYSNEGVIEASIWLKDAMGLTSQEIIQEFKFDVTAPHINSYTYSYLADGSTPIDNISGNANNIYNKIIYVVIEADDIKQVTVDGVTETIESSGVSTAVLNWIKTDKVGSDEMPPLKPYSTSTKDGVTTFVFRLEDSAHYEIWPTVTDAAGNSTVGERKQLTLDAKIPNPPIVTFGVNTRMRSRSLADYRATNSGNEWFSDTVTLKLAGDGGSLGVDHYEYCRVGADSDECVDGADQWIVIPSTNTVELPAAGETNINGALRYKFRIVNTAGTAGYPAFKTLYRDDVKPQLEVKAITADGTPYTGGDTDQDVIVQIKKPDSFGGNVSGVTYEYYTDKDSTRRPIIDTNNGYHTLRITQAHNETYHFIAISGAKVSSDEVDLTNVNITKNSELDFKINKAYFRDASSSIYPEGSWTNAKYDLYLELKASVQETLDDGGYYEIAKGNASDPTAAFMRFENNEIASSALVEGSNYYYIRMSDKDGNKGEWQRFVINVDRTNPVISYNAVAKDADNQEFDVTISATDNITTASEGVQVYYAVYDTVVNIEDVVYNTPVKNSVDFTLNGKDQVKYIYFKACDAAGNCTKDAYRFIRFGNTVGVLPDLNINSNGNLINETKNPTDTLPYLNIDTDGDGEPDVNIDITQDGIPDINLAVIDSWNPTAVGTTLDGTQYLYDPMIKPTINVVENKPYGSNLDKMYNIDTDGDMQPNINVAWHDGNNEPIKTNQVKLHNWSPKKEFTYNGFTYLTMDTLKPEINIDTNGDHYPDTNVDLNGDFIADINKDMDKDGYPDLNIDTDGDGKPDINIDLNGDGKPNKNITTVNKDNWKPNHVYQTGDGFQYSTMDNLKPTLPDVPVDPDKPVDPDNPNKPTDPDNPDNPDNPNNPDNPGNNNGNNNGNNSGSNNGGNTGYYPNPGGSSIIYVPSGNGNSGGNGTISVVDPSGSGSNTDGNGIGNVGNGSNNNMMNGICGSLNIDTNSDGIPDLNIDVDGDGVADYNIDTDCDGKADKNILSKASVLGLYQSNGSASYGGDLFRFALIALATLLLLLLIFLKKKKEEDEEYEEFIEENAD